MAGRRVEVCGLSHQLCCYAAESAWKHLGPTEPGSQGLEACPPAPPGLWALRSCCKARLPIQRGATVSRPPVRHVYYSPKVGGARMTSNTAPPKVYVKSRKATALTCPSCHSTKIANLAQFTNTTTPIKAKCQCGCLFDVPEVVLDAR